MHLTITFVNYEIINLFNPANTYKKYGVKVIYSNLFSRTFTLKNDDIPSSVYLGVFCISYMNIQDVPEGICHTFGSIGDIFTSKKICIKTFL